MNEMQDVMLAARRMRSPEEELKSNLKALWISPLLGLGFFGLGILAYFLDQYVHLGSDSGYEIVLWFGCGAGLLVEIWSLIMLVVGYRVWWWQQEDDRWMFTSRAYPHEAKGYVIEFRIWLWGSRTRFCWGQKGWYFHSKKNRYQNLSGEMCSDETARSVEGGAMIEKLRCAAFVHVIFKPFNRGIQILCQDHGAERGILVGRSSSDMFNEILECGNVFSVWSLYFQTRGKLKEATQELEKEQRNFAFFEVGMFNHLNARASAFKDEAARASRDSTRVEILKYALWAYKVLMDFTERPQEERDGLAKEYQDLTVEIEACEERLRQEKEKGKRPSKAQ